MEEETPRQSRSPRDTSQPHGGQTKSVILPQRPLVAVITRRTFEKKKKKNSANSEIHPRYSQAV